MPADLIPKQKLLGVQLVILFKKTAFLISGLSLLLFFNSCAKQKDPNHVVLSVEGNVLFENLDGRPLKDKLNIYHLEPGEVIKMSFFWKTGKWEPIPSSLQVLVHVMDIQGNLVFQADHPVQPSMTAWQSNQTYRYTRFLHIPDLIPEKIYDLKVGFYDPSDHQKKYYMKTKTENVRKISVARIRLAKMSKIIYREGWMDKSMVESWRWAGKESGIGITNPKQKEYFLHLSGFTTRECFKAPPKLSIKPADGPVEDILFVEGEFDYWSIVTRDMFGDDFTLDLNFSMNESFLPVDCGINADTRDLGMALYPPEITVLRFKDGFYPEETSGLAVWRWMGSEGNIEIVNPFSQAKLYLAVFTTFEKVPSTPQVTVKINDHVVKSFQLTKETSEQLLDLNPSFMGEEKTFILTLTTDTTFKPSSQDSRDLGLMVKSIQLYPVQ